MLDHLWLLVLESEIVILVMIPSQIRESMSCFEIGKVDLSKKISRKHLVIYFPLHCLLSPSVICG
ncbi:hypothetical protein KC19_4G086900 [Ceratodon purpureus]|uniref:Uncharacterized protein n=1 Tax=Ceratodon purpureus TaxID=3225 RepID=A0A8T0I8A1_CERPU|nr:hypothetical protein KC19_4G086900 [Ceratodon purpureus]